VNITVKAPPGGEYDIDIQKVKTQYNWWRWRIMGFRIVFMALLAKWTFDTLLMEFIPKSEFGRELPYSSPVFQVFANGFMNLIFTWQGWIVIAGFIVWVIWVKKFTRNKAHFECPFGNCNEEIRIYEPWECPKCRDNKETIPGLFGTFFDQCKKDHKPESYQCPSCLQVFKLIPNGKTDKFAKCPTRLLQGHNVVPLSAAQPQQQYIPRDRNPF
jgi:hypothetical protein